MFLLFKILEFNVILWYNNQVCKYAHIPILRVLPFAEVFAKEDGYGGFKKQGGNLKWQM